MREVITNVYSFDELNETAKQKAITQHRQDGDFNQFYFDEIIESVKKMANLFNLKFGKEYTQIRTSHIEDNILELKGIRLYKYLVNNYWSSLYKRKFLGTIGDNKIITHRMSKTKFYDIKKGAKVNSSNFIFSNINFENSCVLTGVCYDNDILQPIYDFLATPSKETTFEDLINGIENSIKKCFNDVEAWINSDEFITETIVANEYEFTIDGNLF